MSTTGAVRYTFRKSERLCRKTVIEKLFSEGSSFYIHPFKVFWLKTPLPGNEKVQVLITAGKKNYKKAVARNRAKRVIREAYRMNKYILYDHLREKDDQFAIAIILAGNEVIRFKDAREKILSVIHRLISELNKTV